MKQFIVVACLDSKNPTDCRRPLVRAFEEKYECEFVRPSGGMNIGLKDFQRTPLGFSTRARDRRFRDRRFREN